MMEERELAPGNAILLYTDGVTEALNGEGEEFGEQRLLAAARQHSQLPCRSRCQQLQIRLENSALMNRPTTSR